MDLSLEEVQLIRLYRELCLYKQILDTKSDFAKLCADCKSFKPIGQTATTDIGLQACYDCLNKICYPLCGLFWYTYSVNWPKKVFLCVFCVKKREFLKRTGLWYPYDTGLIPSHGDHHHVSARGDSCPQHCSASRGEASTQQLTEGFSTSRSVGTPDMYLSVCRESDCRDDMTPQIALSSLSVPKYEE